MIIYLHIYMYIRLRRKEIPDRGYGARNRGTWQLRGESEEVLRQARRGGN